MVYMSNKSILLGLVACVEFPIIYQLHFAQQPAWGCWIIKQYQTEKVLFHWCSKLNGVRLQRYSGLDTGIELEKFHSNSFKKYNKNNAYIV